ncbi:MAG: fructose-6-phosphate aldolase [Alphaproteobacteria bacterium]
MKFFIDSADIAEIEKLMDTGMVDGVTTNPSLIAKSGRKFNEVAKEICALVDGPVSLEAVATDKKGMLQEAAKLTKIADNICVKLPLTPDGLAACKELRSEDILVNVTLCFSPNQALLAAKAGASFISPFVGRLDDISVNGMRLIEDIVTIYDQYERFETEVLVASARHPDHVLQSALLGADVVTVPPALVWKLYQHPLTDKGLGDFLKDWKNSNLAIE